MSPAKIKANEHLRQVLNYMATHNLPPTPVNYTVWYEYVSGQNLGLKNAMDLSMAQKHPFGGDQIKELYQKFITDENDLLARRLFTKFKIMLHEINRHLAKTQHSLNGQDKHLEKLSNTLQKIHDQDDVQKAVAQLREGNQAMRETGNELVKKIQLSSRELFQLRDELEKYQDQGRRDHLTGLLNRRGLAKVMEVERIRARQNNTPFSLVLINIDHFKELNGTHGPLVGDSFLKELAKILKKHLRQNDIPIRFNREEFMALLPETQLNGAMAAAGKIQNILRSKEWLIKGSGENIGRITVSMGVAVHEENDTEDSLIQRANQALKMAKTTGRNRIFSQAHLQN